MLSCCSTKLHHRHGKAAGYFETARGAVRLPRARDRNSIQLLWSQGLAAHGAGLESLDDADLIRGKILAFERAEEIAALDQADTEKIRQLLTFVLMRGRAEHRSVAYAACGMQRYAESRITPNARAMAAA